MSTAAEVISTLYGAPLSVLSDCLRGFLIAKPGHELIGADFSAIEARVLAWLAGEEKILHIFRTHGLVYEAAAADIYRVPIAAVTKAQRQIGKVAVLALGYQGGVGAFQNMARDYGVKVSDEQAEGIKVAWRQANPNIRNYWYETENAAKDALRNPGMEFYFGPVGRRLRYKVKGNFLFCRLPSGRLLSYPYAKLNFAETKFGPREQINYKAEDTFTRKFVEQTAYGGLLVENITQAVARDLLADAMVRLEERNYPIVLHVHDEVVSEVPKEHGSVEEFEKITSEPTAWSAGLPIAAEGWRGKRYRK